jgi:amino acid adenylation domain-containing protein
LIKYRLTNPQRNIYFADIATDTKQLFNIYGYIKIKGSIDLFLFFQAIMLLHKKFPILRGFLKKEDEYEPYFEIQHHFQPIYQFIDLSGKKDSEEALNAEIKKEKQYKFKLSNTLLFRNNLYKINKSEYVWLFNIHHIINDGWGASVLVESCSEIYRGLLNKKNTIEENNSFEKYSDFEEVYIRSEKYEKDKIFWKEKLIKFQPFYLEKGFSNRKNSIEGERLSQFVSGIKAKTINRFIKERNISPHVFFMSVFYIFLYKLFNTNKISIATAVLNRPNSMFKSTVGMFLNFIPNIIEIQETDSIHDVLKNVQLEMKRNFKHQRFPIVGLYQELGYQRDDLYPFLFNYQNSVHDNHFASIPTEQEWLFNNYEEHAISININDRHNSGEYQIHFDYNKSTISNTEMRYYAERYLFLIDQIVEKQSAISDYLFIPKREEDEIRKYLTGKSVEYTFTDLAQLIDRNAERFGEKIAIGAGNSHITYSELSELSGKLAKYLLSFGLKKGSFIPVFLDASIDSIISLFAIFKIGGIYVPIDSSYPAERIKFIINDCNVSYLIANKKIDGFKIIDLNDFYQNVEPDKNIKTKQSINETDYAYTIYTSGSTGKPKGVLVRHEQISHYLNQFINYFKLSESDIVAQQASISFDTSLEEILPALAVGARLEILDREILLNPNKLVTELIEKKITLLSSSPTIIAELNQQKIKSNTLKILISGGDVLYENQIDFLKSQYCVFNTYGPTETTICVSYAEIKDGQIHLGSPINNMSIYLLNDLAEEIGFSSIGEVCISGIGLADSYLNQEKLTNESFVIDETIKKRMYKTGDLARLLPTGELLYCGRKDFQVNIHGHRIELGEIDFHLNQIPDVLNAVTIVRKEIDTQFLKSFLETKNGRIIDQETIRGYLEKRLPNYMLPASIQFLDKLPTNSNGKIDRNKVEKLVQIQTKDRAETFKTETEIDLASIWSDLLTKKVEDRHANFIEYGGNSLTITQLAKRIKSYFGIEISFKDIFTALTIKKIADIIELKSKSHKKKKYTEIKKSKTYALSRSQERIWIIEQFKETGAAYNIPIAVRLEGLLDSKLVEKTVQSIINDYESLRTYFVNKMDFCSKK